MDIQQFVQEWLAASNDFDTGSYLKKWHKDAALDDRSVGHIFKGHSGIQKYFEDYFIGYNTKTRLIKLIISDNAAHIDVEFTGTFPEGKIGGKFDLVFKDGKIVQAKASLI